MNLQQLYYFRTLYAVKNYTQASKDLMIAQSSLSHSIADLERELGVPLFYRRGRNIESSSYADKFYVHIQNIINELETATREIQEDLYAANETIHIGMSYTLSLKFMPEMIRGFCMEPGNENVRFEWKELTAAYVNEALMNHTIDLGFGAKIRNDQLDFHYICSDEVALIAPPNHYFARLNEVDLTLLNNEHLITFPHTCGTRYYIDGVLEEKHVRPRSIQEVSTEKMMAGLVAAGRGVALIPVLPDLTMYDVVKIPLKTQNLFRPMYMEWERGQSMRPAVRRFMEYVINNAERMELP